MSHRNHFLRVAATVVAGVAVSSVFAAEPFQPSGPSANPAFANPDTPGLLDGKPAADVVNAVDVTFLKQLAIGGRAEVELGKLAGERSSVANITTFGKRMVKDHGDANGKLASLARSAKVSLPDGLDAEHEAARTELQAQNGANFDRKYIESQIKDHQKAVELLIHEIGSGQHAGVRQFAAQTLPAVMEHLDMAKSLLAEVAGAAPPR
jgi:putative membrane protein